MTNDTRSRAQQLAAELEEEQDRTYELTQELDSLQEQQDDILLQLKESADSIEDLAKELHAILGDSGAYGPDGVKGAV